MLCKEITKKDYPTATTQDSRQHIESLLKEDKVDVLPLLSDGKLIGIVSNELLDFRKEEDISQLFSGLTPEWVAEEDHVFRALRLMSHQHMYIVAVHDNNGEYVGVITANDLLPAVAMLLGMNDAPSGSLTIEMDRNDYSFKELARIVESNDTEIIQLNSYIEASTGLFVVTLKVSREDISDIVSTLQRYDYHVRYYFGRETYENELKSNYEALINYLNI